MSKGEVVEHQTKSFRGLVGAQFLGSFNDNLFKQLILFLAASTLFPGKDLQGLAFMVFALPFVVFSGMAGDLSERFSKRNIIVRMKVLEIIVMALGLVALQMQSWNFMLLILFIMGIQSAFFGPSKYGVIPEIIPPKGLIQANGVIAMTTFMGVLLGQALAGPLLDYFPKRLWVSGAACVLFAVIGTLLASRMEPLPQQKPDLKIKLSPFGRLFQTMKELRRQEGLMLVVVLNSMFWFNAGVIQQAITALGEKEVLNISKGGKWKLSMLMVILAVSIIIGSIVVPKIKKLSAGRLAMAGALGMLTGQSLLLLVGPVVPGGQIGLYFAGFIMAMIGFTGAFFVVPVQSYLQHAPPAGMKGQTFAVNNFMNFLFLVLAGGYYLLSRNVIGLGPTLSQAIAGVIMISVLFVFIKYIRAMSIPSE